MIIQVSNIVSGFVLASPKLKELGGKETIEKAESSLNKFRGTIGLIALVLGITALLERMQFEMPIGLLGSSYPQAIIAIVIGLILSARLFAGYPAIQSIIKQLSGYAEWIGIAGIVVGLYSLL